jgi:peptidoglycan/xylan/chitin deacetylase (PgdA/CDA1 family)
MVMISPIILEKFLPNVLWRMRDKKVYLTFDDGPDPELTPRFLALLQRYEVKATFFVIGQKAQRFPKIVLQIKEHGHTIGNHSFSHRRMLWKSEDTLRFELNKTDEILYKITGQKPALFRPPHGHFGIQLLKVVKSTNHKIVLWSASVHDYKSYAIASTIQNKLQKTMGPGQIILLHDGHPNGIITFKALEETLRVLKDHGIEFSAILEENEPANRSANFTEVQLSNFQRIEEPN